MNFLEKKKLDLVKQAEWISEQINDVKAIKQFMLNRLRDLQLTPMQKEKMVRWQFAFNQLHDGRYTEKEVCDQLVNTYAISESSAYKDIRDMKEVYGDTLSFNKRFEIQMQLNLLKVEQQKARELNNTDDYAKLQRAWNDLVKLMPDDIEENPADFFTGHTIVNQFDPKLIGSTHINSKEMMELINTLQSKYAFKNVDTSIIQDLEFTENLIDEPTDNDNK